MAGNDWRMQRQGRGWPVYNNEDEATAASHEAIRVSSVPKSLDTIFGQCPRLVEWLHTVFVLKKHDDKNQQLLSAVHELFAQYAFIAPNTPFFAWGYLHELIEQRLTPDGPPYAVNLCGGAVALMIPPNSGKEGMSKRFRDISQARTEGPGLADQEPNIYKADVRSSIFT